MNKLREAELLINQGNPIAVVTRKIGVSDYTYYRWRKEYGGMRVDQARRLKELEQENTRLKKVVADFGWLAEEFPVPTDVLHTDGRDPYWR